MDHECLAAGHVVRLGPDGEPLVCLTREQYDGLHGAAAAVLAQLDYLQGLWGKEGVTNTLAGGLRAALAAVDDES